MAFTRYALTDMDISTTTAPLHHSTRLFNPHSMAFVTVAMNDTMEGKLVRHTFARLAEKDSVDLDYVRRLQDAIGTFEKIIDRVRFLSF